MDYFVNGMVSTYPDGDEAERQMHYELLQLEKAGQVTRHCDMEHSDQVQVRHVIWVPVEAPPPVEPPPTEPEV